MAQLERLTLASLAEIDGGRLALAFEQALKRCVLDCEDRPGESKPRKLTLNLELTPTLDEDLVCDNVKLQFHISDNVPKRRTKKYDMSLRKGGHLLFQPDSLDNVDQTTFEFNEESES